MSAVHNPVLLGGLEGYQINNSLRFRSSASAYLNKTFAANGNRTTWTMSFWAKLGNLTSGFSMCAGAGTGIGVDVERISLSNGSFYWQRAIIQTSQSYVLQSNAVLRDPSAWYHVVVVWDSNNAIAANRWLVYLNGVNLSLSAQTTVSSGQTSLFNSTSAWKICRYDDQTSSYGDCYLTEVNFIDGQALTPSSFGQTDPATGVWAPKPYSGTYGTNGFYLPFSNIATTSGSNAGLGKDFSGNGNYWATNNISVTAGSTYDAMIDSPTNAVTGTQPVGNYATLNPTIPASYGGPLSDGNLKFSLSVGAGNASATIGVLSTGKWYYEQQYVSGNGYGVGIQPGSQVGTNNGYGGTNSIVCYACESTNRIYNNGSITQTFSSITASDVLGVAFDCDAKTVTFYKNGVQLGNTETITTTTGVGVYVGNGSGTQSAVGTINFGQRPFTYTPPSGFKALCTSNLPDPTIGATSSTQANKFVDATLYTGNGSTQSITNSGGFQPDLVWVKSRSNVLDHKLTDVVRGVTKGLISDTTGAETTDTNGVTAFNSNGFSLGTDSNYNTNAYTYVGWQWKAGGAGVTNTSGSITSTVSANPTAGFSIVTYTGTGANATVGHGLGVAPKMMIVKKRSALGTHWGVYHSYANASPATGYLQLQLTNSFTTAPDVWNNTAPTSSVFSIGTGSTTNDISATYVAYVWAEVTGFSKFGSYTANGSTDGPFVYCGFRPKLIITKKINSTSNWGIIDTAVNATNQATTYLLTNSSSAVVGGTSGNGLDILSNGFKARSSDGSFNETNADTYIFAAFAESPLNFSRAR